MLRRPDASGASLRRGSCAGSAELGDQLVDVVSGFEIDDQLGCGERAQGGTELIDRAALQAVPCDQQFAARFHSARPGDDAFQGLAFGLREHFRRPGDSQPQFAGWSGVTATPSGSRSRVHAPSEPVSGHEPPPSARITASAS